MAEKEFTKTEQRIGRNEHPQIKLGLTLLKPEGIKPLQRRARSVNRWLALDREDNGTAERMSRREAAAGLNLAGNDTMSGRGGSTPSMYEREAASGLTNTMSGREDPFYSYNGKKNDNSPTDFVVHAATDDRLPSSQEAFAAIICVNGNPHYASIQGRIGDEIV